MLKIARFEVVNVNVLSSKKEEFYDNVIFIKRENTNMTITL